MNKHLEDQDNDNTKQRHTALSTQWSRRWSESTDKQVIWSWAIPIERWKCNSGNLCSVCLD